MGLEENCFQNENSPLRINPRMNIHNQISCIFVELENLLKEYDKTKYSVEGPVIKLSEIQSLVRDYLSVRESFRELTYKYDSSCDNIFRRKFEDFGKNKEFILYYVREPFLNKS